MKLRKLELKDAAYMLEWMHDPSVVEYMGTNFAEKTIDDCRKFIEASQICTDTLNLAVTDDEDNYMGTVSLKHIDREKKTAEFAITVSAAAMGKGYSKYGMRTILEKGIRELLLEKIYWCVSAENLRAVRFYDKSGYMRTEEVPRHIKMPYDKKEKLLWYVYDENVKPKDQL